jgi:hypothetical protein
MDRPHSQSYVKGQALKTKVDGTKNLEILFIITVFATHDTKVKRQNAHRQQES